MALDVFTVISGIIELLRLALMATIPVFLIGITALFAKKKLSKKFGLNWIQSAFIVTYTIITITLALLYVVPYYLAWIESPLASQTVPSILANTPRDIALAIAASILKILLNALLLTIIVLPLEFFASFVSEKILAKKNIPNTAKTFITAYCTCFLAIIIVFFAFPWIISGILYLVFWG